MIDRVKKSLLGLFPARAAGRLRAWRVHKTIERFEQRIVEHRFGTGPLKAYISDPLAQGWYDHDWPELPEIIAMRERLKSSKVVFDCGAHQGVVALMLAREVGTGGSVVAVEANAHNFAAMCKNRELNEAENLHALHAAVSDRCGSLTFNERLNGQIDDGSGASGAVRVDAVTVDELAARFGMPDVVFLDIEGAECMALAGAVKVLASDADFFIEVHVNHGLEALGGSVARIFTAFPAERYTLLGRAENDVAFRPITEQDSLTRDRFFLLAEAIRKPLP